MESNYCLNAGAGTLYVLAPQQLVDCAGHKYGNLGCNGGDYPGAWNYLESHGQELEADYPYTAKDGTCSYNSAKGKVKTTYNSNGVTYFNAGFTSGNANE